MSSNRNGSTGLDRAVSAEVRAEIGRQKISVSGLADALRMRRATLSARINGHVGFTSSELAGVAELLGTSASELTSRAERALATERIPA